MTLWHDHGNGTLLFVNGVVLAPDSGREGLGARPAEPRGNEHLYSPRRAVLGEVQTGRGRGSHGDVNRGGGGACE